MSTARADFRSFVERLATNTLRADDWDTHIRQPSDDPLAESVREELQETAERFGFWETHQVPRGIQVVAKGWIGGLGPDTSYYRLPSLSPDHCEPFTISVSVWTPCSHSSCFLPVTPQKDDYGFWHWLVTESPHRGTRRTGEEIEKIREEFEALRPGDGGI